MTGNSDTTAKARGLKMVAYGTGSEIRLESDYVPLAIRFPAEPSHRELHSVRLAGHVPPEGDGAGEIWLDTRVAHLNSFGDAVQRIGPEPASVRVEFRFLTKGLGEKENQASTSRRKFVREPGRN